MMSSDVEQKDIFGGRSMDPAVPKNRANDDSGAFLLCKHKGKNNLADARVDSGSHAGIGKRNAREMIRSKRYCMGASLFDERILSTGERSFQNLLTQPRVAPAATVTTHSINTIGAGTWLVRCAGQRRIP